MTSSLSLEPMITLTWISSKPVMEHLFLFEPVGHQPKLLLLRLVNSGSVSMSSTKDKKDRIASITERLSCFDLIFFE